MAVESTQSWERVAAAAASLFHARGYDAVGVRDIADSLGMKAASLYYHCPGGKEELYLRAMRHSLDRYEVGLREAARREEDLLPRLEAMADFVLAGPPIDVERIVTADLASLEDRKAAAALSDRLFRAVHAPFEEILKDAQKQRVIRMDIEPELVAGLVFTAIARVGFKRSPGARTGHHLESAAGRALVRQALGVILDGARPR